MAVTHVQISRRTQTELGPDGIKQLCRHLFAIDCQTCGKPLNVPTPAVAIPAVAVTDYGDIAHATLHHPGCRQPSWAPPDTLIENTGTGPTLTHTTFDVLQIIRDPHGCVSRMPTVLLNPSLEAATLDRQPDGSWTIGTPDLWTGLGFVRTGRIATELPDVPGATATLVRATDGSKPVVTITLAQGLQWELPLVHTVAGAVAERGGVALLLLSDVNPGEYTIDTFNEKAFHKLLLSATAAAGWIPLVHTSARASEQAPTSHPDALPSKDPAHPH
jgi:hypothetical protein